MEPTWRVAEQKLPPSLWRDWLSVLGRIEVARPKHGFLQGEIPDLDVGVGPERLDVAATERLCLYLLEFVRPRCKEMLVGVGV